MSTDKQIEKAKKSLEYQIKKASNCRHEVYQISCNSCRDNPICEIQLAIKKAREIINN